MHRALFLSCALSLAAPTQPAGAVHVSYDKQAQILAGKLPPPGLTAKADPNGLKFAQGQIAAALTEIEKSAASNGPGAHALLKTAFEKFRPDVGPARRTVAVTTLEEMWNTARVLGAFDEAHQFTGKITRGADAGGQVVFEYVVPPSLEPRFSRDLVNVRLVPPSRARGTGAPPTPRELAFQKNLESLAREIEGRKSLEARARSVPTDASGLTKEEALKRWKAEAERNGDAAQERPDIVLKGLLIATPSKRTAYKWRVEAELVNLSHHATEVELECIVLGTTWKKREDYIMADLRQKVQLRSAQKTSVTSETLDEKTYKARCDLYENLDKKTEVPRSQVNYRGTLWRVTHPKGEVAVFATDDALLKMLDSDSKLNLENMARMYLDPKDWPKSATAGVK